MGISYTLPKGLIRGKLVVREATATFAFCLQAAPIPVADPGQQYVMPFNNNVFSADKYTIQQDDTTGRLKSINVTTKDRFDEFVVNLGKSAGALTALRPESSFGGTSLCDGVADAAVLASIDIDPANYEQLNENLIAVNEVLLRYARRMSRRCDPTKPAVTTGLLTPAQKALVDAYEACLEYRYIAKTYSQQKPPLFMRWTLPTPPRLTVEADCSVGFCYRHTLPYTVQVGMIGSSVHSYTYQLPNDSPIIAMDINRAITVTKTTSISFGDLGQMTNITVQKGNDDGTEGSEAEGLALLPATVIKAYFQSFTDTTNIIAGAFTSEKTRIDNEIARDQSQISLIEKRQALAAKINTANVKAERSRSETGKYAIVASNGIAGVSNIPPGIKQPADLDPDAPVNNANQTDNGDGGLGEGQSATQ